MKVNVVKIGNSRGIRIPKPLLAECGIGDIVDLQVRKGELVVLPVRETRRGWAESFQEMAEHGDDALLDGPVATRWDRSEWEW